MNAGLFTRHVILNIPSGSASLDQFGQSTYAYYTASCFAKVDEKSGNQVNTEGVIHDNAYNDFTMRYRDDVTEDTTIIYKGQTYRITSIQVLPPRDFYMRLSCSRRN